MAHSLAPNYCNRSRTKQRKLAINLRFHAVSAVDSGWMAASTDGKTDRVMKKVRKRQIDCSLTIQITLITDAWETWNNVDSSQIGMWLDGTLEWDPDHSKSLLTRSWGSLDGKLEREAAVEEDRPQMSPLLVFNAVFRRHSAISNLTARYIANVSLNC